MHDLSKIGESPVDMSHRSETRGWLGNNGKQWETRFPLSVGRISLLHHTLRGKETRFRINYIILCVGGLMHQTMCR